LKIYFTKGCSFGEYIFVSPKNIIEICFSPFLATIFKYGNTVAEKMSALNSNMRDRWFAANKYRIQNENITKNSPPRDAARNKYNDLFIN